MEEFVAASLALLATLAGFGLVLASVINAEGALSGVEYQCGRLAYVAYSGGYVYAYYQGCPVALKSGVEAYVNGSWTLVDRLVDGALVRAPSSDGRLVLETSRGALVASP
ncbi:hypothetical protein [Desulfurococcus amylolyticus]|uniref:hypothetical protein n=1 Tax=Desulfurococcaceae TaxID=2272 RepID=UPI0005B1FDC3|nr:hypothetical protein [Desulfurococcus amylolyticus]